MFQPSYPVNFIAGFLQKLLIQCVGDDLLEGIWKKTVGAFLKELFQQLRGRSDENHINSD
jgi:hypothetical protein